MTGIRLANVSKGYGSGAARSEVLHDINLDVKDGEFVAVVGFSGSGKTTLISLLAGLIEPDSGQVLCDGEPVTGPSPSRGIVFQTYALLPWLTVTENIAMAVDQVMRNRSREQRAEWVRECIATVNLTEASEKKPHELSGGMRQRVAVARALAMNPTMLLLDEPLSALDALTRATLQSEIERLWQRDRKTVVLITNDVDEGILLADRIVALKPGPGATLGASFDVDLARPRDRESLNHDPEFVKLRNTIVDYLVQLREDHRSEALKRGPKRTLPDIQPSNLITTRSTWRAT